jgi:hypothetical protein
MRRKKRLSILRIAVATAVVAAIVPVAAMAKPHAGPTYEVEATYQLGPGEIPYLSQGQGVDATQLGQQLGADDRPLLRTSVVSEPSVVIPYMSQGKGVTSAELGFVVGNAADDRPFARSTPEQTPVVSDDGWSIDINPYVMTGSALILLALGMGFALWYTRRTRLSPA